MLRCPSCSNEDKDSIIVNKITTRWSDLQGEPTNSVNTSADASMPDESVEVLKCLICNNRFSPLLATETDLESVVSIKCPRCEKSTGLEYVENVAVRYKKLRMEDNKLIVDGNLFSEFADSCGYLLCSLCGTEFSVPTSVTVEFLCPDYVGGP